ncbi:hypothetical protein JZ751_016877, partial [Albula glossodonta]
MTDAQTTPPAPPGPPTVTDPSTAILGLKLLPLSFLVNDPSTVTLYLALLPFSFTRAAQCDAPGSGSHRCDSAKESTFHLINPPGNTKKQPYNAALLKSLHFRQLGGGGVSGHNRP